MLLELIPDQLYRLPNIKTLLRNDNSVIFYKILREDLIDKEMYLSTVAILYVLKGQQIISNYDGKKVVVEAGQLLYLSKEMYIVSDFVRKEGVFEAVIFFFDDKFIENKCHHSRREEKPANSIPTLQSNTQINKYIHSLLDIYLNANNSSELLDVKLLELLALIKLHEGGGVFLSSFYAHSLPDEKRDIREFMKSNYLKNLKVGDYALLTGRSKSTFIREFKKLYNATPNQWLIEQRLEKAHHILMSSNMSVTDTAFEVGYENVSHFITAYKKKFKATPKQSRGEALTRISY
ncbi:hypothetical protein MNBD_GAMMA10-2599 [hydrothermal vent metagenome]|uniref:HTH araC/xylS-type domain-containing protein n=1 Tax=hydrothermal vent metagenome TaxID=652676 RepID=A0A3B0XNU1_9ZZZZ